jgi:aminoglycoside phosphotransferase (APT) family kinase protein
MTVTEIEAVVAALRGEAGYADATLAGPPETLRGGFWASISRLRLAGVAPPADRLVLRVMPDANLAAKETVMQTEVARQGFPAPLVRLSGGRDSVLGRPFLLMDEAPGKPPLDGLNGPAAIRQLPALARRLPNLLAEASARLHALDAEPIRVHARAHAGMDVSWTIDQFVAQLARTAETIGRPDLAEAARWLTANQPDARRESVCHGDLHPFNLLVQDDHWSLIDWTTALIADPAYDLAFTTLMLRNPPLYAPRPLRVVISSGGRLLARRFLAAYRRAGGQTPTEEVFAWYTGVHALRSLIELASWADATDPAAHTGHPWYALEPVMSRHLSTLTGIAIVRTTPVRRAEVLPSPEP